MSGQGSWGDGVVARDQVARELEELHAEGGALHFDSPRATSNHYGSSVSRLRLWRQAIDEFTQGEVPAQGLALIVTAGPPGGGKSSAVASLGLEAAYRRIDPDEIKVWLLEREVQSGLYEDLLATGLSDGRQLMPFEMASLVHKESVELAAAMRRLCLAKGENLLIEGTLRWHGQPDVHVRELNGFGYERLDVLLVDVPEPVAQQRALDRWWSDRVNPAATMGGRVCCTDW